MQEYLHQTADAGDSLSDSGFRRHSIRQRMQEFGYLTADAGVSLSDSECRRLSIRQQMQETLYQTADAGDREREAPASAVSWGVCCIRCLIERLLHPLSDGDTSASAV